MYWKLSIDLSRPLVASMGQHDPLDGFVTCAAARGDGTRARHRAGPRSRSATADFAAMIEPGELATADPLGLGGLLVDACRVAQLDAAGRVAADAACSTRCSPRRSPGCAHYVAAAGSPRARRSAVWRSASSASRSGSRAADAGRAARGRPPAPRARAIGAGRATLPLRAEIESFWLRARASRGRHLARARGHQRRDARDEPPAGGLPRAPHGVTRPRGASVPASSFSGPRRYLPSDDHVCAKGIRRQRLGAAPHGRDRRGVLAAGGVVARRRPAARYSSASPTCSRRARRSGGTSR